MPDPSPPTPTRPAWGDPAHRRGLLAALADAVGVLATTARLLARHWPVLLATFLAAVVARELVMRAAVRLSAVNAELGFLVLLLVPMTTLTALVLMLRLVRPSLPYLGGGDRPPSVLEHLGSVLVPFMTIYYFEDDLTQDIFDYHYRIAEDTTEQIFANLGESLDTGQAAEPVSSLDRLALDLSVTLVGVVLVTIAARWLLSRWSDRPGYRWLGIPGAYLELVWLTLVGVVAFQSLSEQIVAWGGNRRLFHALRTVWDQGVGTASGTAPATEGPTEWVVGQLGSVDAVLVIPISWLAVGAVVLGYGAAGPAPPGAGTLRRRRLVQRAEHRWQAAPRAIRWAGGALTADLRDRFLPLVHGVRMLLRAGVVPMLLFCLAFVTAQRLADWLWELQRLLVGPQDPQAVWSPLSWPLGELNRAAGTVVLVCLLAAGVDRAVHAARRAPPEPTGPPEPPGPPEDQPEPAAGQPDGTGTGSTGNRT